MQCAREGRAREKSYTINGAINMASSMVWVPPCRGVGDGTVWISYIFEQSMYCNLDPANLLHFICYEICLSVHGQSFEVMHACHLPLPELGGRVSPHILIPPLSECSIWIFWLAGKGRSNHLLFFGVGMGTVCTKTALGSEGLGSALQWVLTVKETIGWHRQGVLLWLAGAGIW